MTKTRSGIYHRKRRVNAPTRFYEEDFDRKLVKRSVKYEKFMRTLPKIHKYPCESTLNAKQVREEYKKLRSRVAFLEKDNRERQAEINDLLGAYDVEERNDILYRIKKIKEENNELREMVKPLKRKAEIAEEKLKQVEMKVEKGERTQPWKECEICCIEFDEKIDNLKPRVLGCGHTLCHACIRQIIKKPGIVCPFCNALTTSLVYRMPINYWILQSDSQS